MKRDWPRSFWSKSHDLHNSRNNTLITLQNAPPTIPSLWPKLHYFDLLQFVQQIHNKRADASDRRVAALVVLITYPLHLDMSRCCGFVVQLVVQQKKIYSKFTTNRRNGVWAYARINVFAERYNSWCGFVASLSVGKKFKLRSSLHGYAATIVRIPVTEIRRMREIFRGH